jgi:hypothetical protein
MLMQSRRRRAPFTLDDVRALVLLAGQFSAQGARPIVTQLCLGLCAIALRSSDWPPEQLLPVLAQTCNDSLPSDLTRSVLLQLVAVLPEEVSSAPCLNIAVHQCMRITSIVVLRHR